MSEVTKNKNQDVEDKAKVVEKVKKTNSKAKSTKTTETSAKAKSDNSKKATEGTTKQVKKKTSGETKSQSTTKKAGTTKNQSTTKKTVTAKSKSTAKVTGEGKSKATTEPKKTTKTNTSKKTTKKTASKPASKKADKDEKTTKNKIEKNENSVEKEVKQEQQEEKKEAETKKIEQEQIEVETLEETVEKQNENDDESKYDTISLKEIREALENKVDKKQKKSVIKEVIINIGIAVFMIAYLMIIIMGSKNIDGATLEKDLKIMTLGILALGISVLEVSYKKDKSKIALIGVETLVFGAANLCLIYISKLYMDQLVRIITYISIVIGGYYIFKSIVLAITSISRLKKDNNDIKDIVVKKAKVNDENEVEEN